MWTQRAFQYFIMDYNLETHLLFLDDLYRMWGGRTLLNEYTSRALQEHTVIGESVKPNPSQSTCLASLQTNSKLERQLLSQYVAPQEHTVLMQVPSNSIPPGKIEEDIKKNCQNVLIEEPIDSESIKGIFGWETVDDTSIPYILRQQKKFVSVRIVERKLLSKYPNTFPDELSQKEPLVSYFITEAEAGLLNEINTAHCDFEYGHNPFTVSDLIVDLEEFEEFFRVVKKTFPADVLAKINEEPALPVMSPPVKTDLSKFCGWIQINNTVSPYILRFDNGKQVKLVPLSVIVYAAGLMSHSVVDGLLPTMLECEMLNEACRVAGFDFLFGKSTRLISISEVIHRCQVQLFELPFKNPLQHARYINSRTGQPSSGPLLGLGSHPLGTTPSVQHQSPPPLRSSQGNMNFLTGNSIANLNSYPAGFPQSDFHPPQVTMSSSLSNVPSGQASFQEPLSSAAMHLLRSHAGIGMEPSNLPGLRSQGATEKNIDNGGGSMWSTMQRGPPQAHVHNAASSTLTPEALPITSNSPNTSVYQPHSLPPNPLLHSISSPTRPDLNHTIFRSPMGMAPRSTVTQSMHKDLTAKYTPPVPGLPSPPSQYSISQSLPFRANRFDSSIFARTNQIEQRSVGDATMSSTQPSTHRHSAVESQKHSGPQSANSTHRSIQKPGLCVDSNPHILTSVHPAKSLNNNHQGKPDLSHIISACLVNGKSISCINVDLPHRKGKFCLVEAVSKLYFPTVPLTEFVKVLQVVLKINLHECTSQEEAAFVQYYSLPVNKLKCNKIIKVDDLEMYFPQLSYMFTKCSSDPTAEQTALHLSLSAHSAANKRRLSTSPSGPPVKTVQPKIENVVRMLHSGRDTTQNGDSNSGRQAPVIVIDDE